MLLNGKVALVSGVGPGVGREVALAFARQGADVVLGARSTDKLEAVAAEVQQAGRRAVFASTDIADADACRTLVALGLEAFGRLDVAVNNAFVQPPFETIEDGSAETWRTAFETNVFGSLNMTRAVLAPMRAARSGSIVFVSSMSARRIMAGLGAYAATKAALLTTVQTLAREVGADGIRVNSVVPGYIWGPSLKWWFKHLASEQGRTPEDVYADVAAETCLNKIPDSAEVADTILFLASDLARAVTGQALDVNAGHWFH